MRRVRSTRTGTTTEHLGTAGNPLIVPNVWDAVTARIVAAVPAVPGVKAIATASHSISNALGVEDGEAL